MITQDYVAAYRQAEKESGERLAEVYVRSPAEVQVKIFREIAKESDWCIMGFTYALSANHAL